jgi:cytochrome c oxidase accessory protein FixG
MKQKLYKPKRRITQALFSLIIILIPFFNIVRLDVTTKRFYFFNSVLWVEEFYFLFLFLMLFTWLILTFSMIYGRVWCGWMCPQMTWVDLTGWLRRLVRKWLKIKKKKPKLSIRIMENGIVSIFTAVISLLVGFNLVSYFVDPYRMIEQLQGGTLGPVVSGFIVGIALLVFADLIFLREVFCNKACPYAMLQMVITDNKTQLVRYHIERDYECIKCNACVRACTMGIDIRQSPHQTECTHCGDCVDACTEVLGRLKPPLPSLITFSWGEEAQAKDNKKLNFFQRIGLFDIKRWVLVTFAFIFFTVLIVLSQVRQPFAVTVGGDRSTLYQTGSTGEIINNYTLKITNRGIEEENLKVICPDNMQCQSKDDLASVILAVGEDRSIRLAISHSGSTLHPGPNKLELKVRSLIDPQREVVQEIVFFMPEKIEGFE